MNSLDTQYQNLIKTILEHGVSKSDRTGTGTKSIFGYTIRHNMAEGFPLLTLKKMAYKSMATELKWFLKGRTDLRYLLQNGCHIWTGDAYSVYERTHQWDLDNDYVDVKEFEKLILEDDDFNKLWGNLGFIYGKQWRDFNGVDQIKDLIHNIKQDPDSRRLMVNAWNASDLIYMKLPPCHYGFQIYTTELTDDERIKIFCKKLGKSLHYADNMKVSDLPVNIPSRKISLIWNQRSVDTFLGLPFNIASYGLLLELIAAEVNMVPDQLVGSLGDTHLYNNHIEQSLMIIDREPLELPLIKLNNINILKGEFDLEVLDYQSHSTIKAPLSN
tara:strand:+ start:566 stop:1552 length:987 start_codon:yes stop_codon:yes gene_type:complete